MQCLPSVKWFLSLSIMSSMFINVVAYDRISSFFFLWLRNNPLYVYNAFYLSICLSMNICVAWLLRIVLQWTWECKYLFKILNSVFLDMYSSGMAGSYDSSIFSFLPQCTPWGILVPWSGIEPCPLQWKCRILNTGLPRNSQSYF